MVLISINLKWTRFPVLQQIDFQTDFQSYSNAESSNIKLVMCWLNKPKKAVSTRHSWSKIVFQYLYFYFYILHFNSNIFRFPELPASTNFSPKEDMFLQTSTESLKSGKLLPFLGTFTVKEKDSHKLQSS